MRQNHFEYFNDGKEKYESNTLIARYLSNTSIHTFSSLFTQIKTPRKILEVGTGEGYILKILSEKFPAASIHATDLRQQSISLIKDIIKGNKNINAQVEDLQHLSCPDNSFDLVVASEVLEHVPDYKKALQEIHRVTTTYALLSVPNEPLWRILNMCRGKYLSRLGNTEDHVNHWSVYSFTKFVESNGFGV